VADKDIGVEIGRREKTEEGRAVRPEEATDKIDPRNLEKSKKFLPPRREAKVDGVTAQEVLEKDDIQADPEVEAGPGVWRSQRVPKRKEAPTTPGENPAVRALMERGAADHKKARRSSVYTFPKLERPMEKVRMIMSTREAEGILGSVPRPPHSQITGRSGSVNPSTMLTEVGFLC
jgi:hypothetical protein